VQLSISYSFRYLIYTGFIGSTHTMELHARHSTHTRHLFILWARVETTDPPIQGKENVFHLPVCLLSLNFIVVCYCWIDFVSIMTPTEVVSHSRAFSCMTKYFIYSARYPVLIVLFLEHMFVFIFLNNWWRITSEIVWTSVYCPHRVYSHILLQLFIFQHSITTISF